MWVHVEGVWQQQGFCSGQISHIISKRVLVSGPSTACPDTLPRGIHSTLFAELCNHRKGCTSFSSWATAPRICGRAWQVGKCLVVTQAKFFWLLWGGDSKRIIHTPHRRQRVTNYCGESRLWSNPSAILHAS